MIGIALKISIITVCYNSSNTIAETMISLKNQIHKNVEHIIIDGGSTDTTLDILKKNKPPNTKIISEKDDGIYDAMNKGLALASGDVVGFLNSDDFYTSSDVLALVAKVFSDDSVDCCYGDLCYVNQFNVNKIIRYWRSEAFIPYAFKRGWCPPHPTFFTRRSVFQEFGGFNLNFKLAADFEIMARLLEKHRIQSIYLPKVLVHMRLGGVSNKNLTNILRQNYEIFQALRGIGLKPSFFNLYFNKFFAKLIQYFFKPPIR